MRYLRLLLAAGLCLNFTQSFGQIKTEARKIEKLIASCIDSAYASSVYIIEFDTVNNQVFEGSGFSGVVVSGEGHILTVSHAATPKQVYQISFPDGAKHIAMGLGRIGIEDNQKQFDISMLKILKPGKWPFAKMGRSIEMKVNQPAISIAYPGTFIKSSPNVRFGRISNIDYIDNFFESTCKMEPGDSGGPLFDARGRVIGLHSWIEKDEHRNFEVPIDLYLKYWKALNVAIDYTTLPEAESLPIVNAAAEIAPVGDIHDMVKISPTQSKSVVKIVSSQGDVPVTILGTVIDFHSDNGTKTYLISKSSMVAENPKISLGGKNLEPAIITRDKKNDLVLMVVSLKLSGISLKHNAKDLVLSHKELGRILASPLSMDSCKSGILSSVYTEMPMSYSAGNFGANATFIDEKITITQISKGSAAAQHLKLKDQITGINGVRISQPAEYGAELSKYVTGDLITIDAVREGQPIHLKMYLPAHPGARHISTEFSGKKSGRSDGFGRVLVQDAAVKANECGGPVFGLDGEFYGINIARHSRTSTIIMPAGILAAFITGSQNHSVKSSTK